MEIKILSVVVTFFFPVSEGEIFSLYFTGALANTFPCQALFASIAKKSDRKHRAKKFVGVGI